MNFADISLIIIGIVAIVIGVLYFLNKKLTQKASDNEEMIERSKQSVSIFVIDKKRDKISNINMPKAVTDNVPKAYKMMKLNFIKAKVGPQIVTLMCDKHIFNALTVKKNFKAEIAGIYIVSVAGIKSKEEMKQIQKDKKQKAKDEKQKSKDETKKLKSKK